MKFVTKLKRFILLLPLVAGAVLTQSCTEEIDTSSRYTFKEHTIYSYLQSHPEVYSEYCALLDAVYVSDFSATTVSQLLTARGKITCFAPTNEAIQNYLAHLVDSGVIKSPNWNDSAFLNNEDLLVETQKTIVHNSIICIDDANDKQEAYQISDLQALIGKGAVEIEDPNMKNRKLTITKTGENDSVQYVIQGAKISLTNCDIPAINGRIHQIDKVIAPTDELASDLFTKMIKDKKYGYFTMAVLIDACGLIEELQKTEDEEYYNARMRDEIQDLPQHPTFKGNGDQTTKSVGTLPERRYYGFTIFAEDDAWWEEQLGLENGTIVEKTKQEVVELVINFIQGNNPWGEKLFLSDATVDQNYTNEENALNQFVTYHMLPAKVSPSKLVIHFNELWYSLENPIKKASVYDYYTTMGKRRLLKTYEAARPVGGKPGNIYLNRFPKLNNGRGKDANGNDYDYTEKACDDDKKGVEIQVSGNMEIYNTYFYKINDCLFFNDRVAENMGKERIRIDVSTMFKELLSNDIRCNPNYFYKNQCVGIPQDVKYKYLEDCDISENTKFYYLSGRINNTSSWANYQGDELNVVGNYEMTMKLPPVPKDGIYELRMGISANDRRGMCQVYWGKDRNALPAAGIPFDMRMGGQSWNVKGGAALTSIVGWLEDIQGNEDENTENDKQLRNNGYMKAPNYFYMYGSSTSLRHREATLRRIIVREEMKADETYYIQFKSVLEDTDTEFFMDYIEFCPKEVYDNPQEPEDIW